MRKYCKFCQLGVRSISQHPRIVGLEAETEALQGAHDAGAAELARQEALWREAEEELNCAQVTRRG